MKVIELIKDGSQITGDEVARRAVEFLFGHTGILYYDFLEKYYDSLKKKKKVELEMSEYPAAKPAEMGNYLVFMRNENKEGWGWRLFNGKAFSDQEFDAPIIFWLERPPVP